MNSINEIETLMHSVTVGSNVGDDPIIATTVAANNRPVNVTILELVTALVDRIKDFDTPTDATDAPTDVATTQKDVTTVLELTKLGGDHVVMAWTVFVKANIKTIISDPLLQGLGDVTYHPSDSAESTATLCFSEVLRLVSAECIPTIRKYLLYLVVMMNPGTDYCGLAKGELWTLGEEEKNKQRTNLPEKKYGGIMGLAQSLLDDSGAMDAVRDAGTAEEAMSLFLKSGMFTNLAEKLAKLSPGDIQGLLSEVSPSLGGLPGLT